MSRCPHLTASCALRKTAAELESVYRNVFQSCGACSCTTTNVDTDGLPKRAYTPTEALPHLIPRGFSSHRGNFAQVYYSGKVVSPARMSEHVGGVTGRHRNPTELQAALKVINDQLADANDLERPALELVAQKLTEELLEVELEEERKHLRCSGEEAKRPPCRESEHVEAGQHVLASPAAAAGDTTTAHEAAQKAHKQTTGEESDKKSKGKNEDWNDFLKNIPRVLIANGTQKYVLIRISPEHNPNKHLEENIYLVRGNPSVEYHYQCAMETMKELESMGAEGEIIGGGRIECRMKEKEVEIYGHSYQFGRADHAVTAQLIKDAFGSDFQVSWGDYGY